jgi:hypothetical protein
MVYTACVPPAIIARVPNACRLDVMGPADSRIEIGCVRARRQGSAAESPAALDLAGRPLVGDVPVVDDVGALRERQRGSEILLDQHDGLPGVGQIASQPRNPVQCR